MPRYSRRDILRYAAATAGAVLPGGVRANDVPYMPAGIQIGDVVADRAVVWGRCDRPARLKVHYAFDAMFTRPIGVTGEYALPETDYTARIDLTRLPPDRDVFIRVAFEDLTNTRAVSAPIEGHFRTAPLTPRNTRIVWGGDTAGQGWGINTEDGGMRIYDAMRRARPDFFVHCGDTIYADGPIPPEKPAEGGRTWRNVVTPEVAKVAETLDEFRGRYRYNLLDENVRRFGAEVPQVWLWDDHEVVNNWSPSKDLSADDRYTEKNVPLLIARGIRAFLDYAPMRRHSADESGRIYRHLPYGELLDLFVLDMRSYRGPNSANRQAAPGHETAFLGATQLQWLKESLARSRAVWKVIAADMPLGLQVTDGKEADGRPRFENIANGDGPVLGREFELADLLRFMRDQRVGNVVWLTADVHYCAAHRYDPQAARFSDFTPFWEFVAGPLNAGSFGPAALDDTFGPEVMFQKVPPVQNASPFAGHQFFGQVDIDAATHAMTVRLKDINGKAVFAQELAPVGHRVGSGSADPTRNRK